MVENWSKSNNRVGLNNREGWKNAQKFNNLQASKRFKTSFNAD